jgi:HD-GYP domain-containing protein (c-di-GMP phosphodiesterase class II)
MTESSAKKTEAVESARTADLLGALSLASDLAVGLPAEHGLRSCLIALQLAERLALPASDQVTVYYTSLLMDAGCTAWTSQMARRMMSDEIVARRELVFHTNTRNRLHALAWMVRFIAPSAPVARRVGPIADFASHGHEIVREGFLNTCDVARSLAARLGMSPDVQGALLSVFEQWDGGGFPRGMREQDIPLACRIVYISAFFEVFHADAGREGALDLIRKGRGRAFDPHVTDILLGAATDAEFWAPLESNQSLWSVVMALEPESPQRWLTDAQLTDTLVAVADFADLKSPYNLGHSRRVAGAAESIATRLGFPAEELLNLRRAALTHDLGLVAVPSFVLDRRPSDLTRVEREQLRLHPYHSERILANVPALGKAAALVGAHHERVDGQGYYRGLRDRQIPLGAQIIAVADRFDELSHDAPGRPGLAPEAALEAMSLEVGSAFSAAMFEALGQQLGLAQPHAERLHPDWPAGLTDREVEVLQLAAQGLSRRGMSQRLFVSESTVRTHLEHIYAKIGVSSRAAATLFAVENDLLN